MKDNVFSRKAKYQDSVSKTRSKKDLVGFVTQQFKQLVKKNLQVPIKLYQL